MTYLLKNGLLLFLVFQLQFSFAQEKKIAELTKADFISDFNLGMNILKKQHPYPFKLKDSLTFNRQVDSLRKVIEKDPSYSTFLSVMVQKIIPDKQITFSPSIKMLSEWMKASTFFPFPVMIENNKIFINIEGELVPLGSEILSINKLSSTEIINKFNRYLNNNRKSTTATDQITPDFQEFYSIFFPQTKSYELTYIKPGSLVTSSVVLPALKFEVAMHRKKISYFPLNVLQGSKDIDEEFNDQEKVGMLTISSFSPHGVEPYDKFSSFFKEVKKRKYNHVIIDLRNSHGGRLDVAEKLYSFLASGHFKNRYNARTMNLDVTFKDEMIDAQKRKLSSEDLNSRRNYFHENFNKDSTGFFVGNEKIRENIKDYPADKDAFSGNIYVLINGRTLTGASYFSLLVQRNKRGYIIGKETGSGAFSGSSFNTEKFHLAKTNSVLEIPIADFFFFDTFSDNGSGVLPDQTIPMEKFKAYILEKKDPELTFALEIIRKSAQ